MVHHTAKRQKVDEQEVGEEAVLFNSDTLSKIITYLPSIDVLSLALTSKRFGISNSDNDESLIEECVRIAVQDIATDEQLAALPHYDGESSLADYHYLQLLRAPLTFDQLVGGVEYVNSGDKSCICNNIYSWTTAYSNNILRAGKHYVLFKPDKERTHRSLMMGVMRPGQANHDTSGYPLVGRFFQNFSRNMGHGEFNNETNIHCCLWCSPSNGGYCSTSDWNGPVEAERWDRLEPTTIGDELGMLLNLDEGTLSVYKNGRSLGVMKRGLAGPYCWVVSMYKGAGVKIERGTVPPH